MGRMPVGELRYRLAEVLDHVDRTEGRWLITRHGRPVAAIVSVGDYEGLEKAEEEAAREALDGWDARGKVAN